MADPACSCSGFQHEGNERVGGAAALAGLSKPEAGTVKQLQHIVDTAAYEADSRGRAVVQAVVLESQRGDVQRVRRASMFPVIAASKDLTVMPIFNNGRWKARRIKSLPVAHVCQQISVGLQNGLDAAQGS